MRPREHGVEVVGLACQRQDRGGDVTSQQAPRADDPHGCRADGDLCLFGQHAAHHGFDHTGHRLAPGVFVRRRFMTGRAVFDVGTRTQRPVEAAPDEVVG